MAKIQVDQGKNPVINSNFLLRVDAVYDLPCRRISSIQIEQEFQPIQEGGVNDYVHLRKKQASKNHTFQVERYVGVKYFDPLPLGRRLTLPIVLYISRYVDGFKLPKLTYTFTGCTVTGKTYGELNAEKSGLLVETTTIAFERFFALNDIFEEPVPDWEFDTSGKKMEGVGKRKAVRNTEELRKRDMLREARILPETRSARNLSEFLK